MAKIKQTILLEFRSFEKHYGFKAVSAIETPYVKITFRNATTALQVGFEPRDRGVFVLLIRLVNGEIPPYPVNIDPTERINMFYLEDLVVFRGGQMKQHNDYMEATNQRIADAATAVRTYAEDVIKGDFAVFEDLEKIVKSRI